MIMRVLGNRSMMPVWMQLRRVTCIILMSNKCACPLHCCLSTVLEINKQIKLSKLINK